MPEARLAGALSSMSDQNAQSVVLATPLLTAGDVAALLSLPRSSVYEYARRRRDPLPSVLIGRHRRFDRGQLEQWLGTQS